MEAREQVVRHTIVTFPPFACDTVTAFSHLVLHLFMKRNPKSVRIARLAGATALAMGAVGAQAQSVDSLLDKLVDKGILTPKEAQEMREQSDKDFTTAYAAKSGMPEWVTAFKINGDFRGRWEGFYSPNANYADYSRLRYRARIGFTAVMQNNFEAGLRLGSGDLDNAAGINSGTDPISNNQTLQNNGSKKGIFIDQAYMKWSGLNTPQANGALTFGKMQNPLIFSSMVFDNDYTPEGGAAQVSFNLSDKHTLAASTGYIVLDEVGSTYAANDAYIFPTQLSLNSVWNQKLSTMVTGGFLLLGSPETMINAAAPNINVGNSRHGTTGILDYQFNPFVIGGSGTYTLASFPMYPGAFPITVGGEYLLNPAAPDNDTINGSYTSTGNYAYNAGITFGKAGKKGTWEVAYQWRYMGANSWYEELVESDFGAYYYVAQPSSGQGVGYRSGTNVKGHIIKASYSPLDMLTFTLAWYYTQIANERLVSSSQNWDSYMNRIQVDANIKF
jgi:hypothetical protein